MDMESINTAVPIDADSKGDSFQKEVCAWAQKYEKMYFSVIPLNNTKDGLEAPASWRGRQTFRADSELIKKWFCEYEYDYRNIGIVCGRISSLMAIDFIGPNWQKAYAEFCTAFPVLSKKAWNIKKDDGKVQLWFKAYLFPEDIPARVRNIDGAKAILKGKDFYVVAPPSKSHLGQFTLLNQNSELSKLTEQEKEEIVTWFPNEYVDDKSNVSRAAGLRGTNETTLEKPITRSPEANVKKENKVDQTNEIRPLKPDISLPESSRKGFIQLPRLNLDLWWNLSDGERVLLITYLWLAKWKKAEIGQCPYSDHEIADRLNWNRSTVLKYKKRLAKRLMVKSKRGIKGVFLPSYENLVVCGRKQDAPEK
jgi:hypothetical protein